MEIDDLLEQSLEKLSAFPWGSENKCYFLRHEAMALVKGWHFPFKTGLTRGEILKCIKAEKTFVRIV